MQILVIIPARGGSKGIPRKNLRSLNNQPLISYAIQTALRSSFDCDVYVSTDDDEIAFVAEKYQAQVHKRNPKLAQDATTLDPVIYDAYQEIKFTENKEYDLIITLQPTSPLLSTVSLDKAIQKIIDNKAIDTVLSVVNDTHLTWGVDSENNFVPNYIERVNRQQLPKVFKETGSFFISRKDIVTPTSRIGRNVELFELPTNESIDIDTYEDWSVTQYLLSRKKILFCLSGYREIGLGHVYNCLILASEILDHQISFLVDKESDLAFQKIASYNYPVYQQNNEDITKDIIELNPDVIVNDRLDTKGDYVQTLKGLGLKVINFEDLGEGAKFADLVINAIYPESEESLKGHFYGPSFFCARDEFFLHPETKVHSEVKKVLISFGGTDPNNLTEKVLNQIYDSCIENDIQVNVVLGLGYEHPLERQKFSKVNFFENVKSISQFMYEADIAFSSAGRTVYELALMGTPSIILAQNEREMTHLFATEENGFINLGLGETIDEYEILVHFDTLLNDYHLREKMHQKMLKNNIKEGKSNVLKLMRDLINSQ